MLAATIMRAAGRFLSRSGRAAKLLILTYHRVLPSTDPLLSGTVDASTFSWQMLLLAEHFTVLPLMQATAYLMEGSLPARAVCITFDDGYADNATIALPILRKHDLPATFFIATGFLDGGRMWNDTVIESVRQAQGNELDLRALGFGIYPIGDLQARQHTIGELLNRLKYLSVEERLHKAQVLAEAGAANLPRDLMMSSEQVLQLQAAGMEIGAHTANHPILKQLDADAAEKEIRQSRAHLIELGIIKVSAFAYPNGRPGIDYDRSHVRAVMRVGFQLAVTTAWGCARHGTDTFQLPRIAPWDHTPTRFYLRLLKTYAQPSAKFA